MMRQSVLLSSPHYGHSGIVEAARELYKQIAGSNSGDQTSPAMILGLYFKLPSQYPCAQSFEAMWLNAFDHAAARCLFLSYPFLCPYSLIRHLLFYVALLIDDCTRIESISFYLPAKSFRLVSTLSFALATFI